MENKKKIIIVYIPNEQHADHVGEPVIESFVSKEKAFIRSVELKERLQDHQIYQRIDLTIKVD